MRGLLFRSASVFAICTAVLAQSPNAPQIQSASPGLLGPAAQPGIQLPQKPLFPSAASPGGVLQSPTLLQPGPLAPPAANTNIGMPSQGITNVHTKGLTKREFKPSSPSGGPTSDTDKKGAAEKLKSLVPAIPRPQLSSGGTGGAQVVPPGVKGGPPSGSPKSDKSQKDSAEQLKSLVPAIAGPRRPPGEPKQGEEKQAAGKQWEAKPSKSIGVFSPLGAGLGPKSTPPTTGEADPPIPQQSETKITARPLQATPASTPDMDSEQSGMAEEKIEIAKEKVERP